MSDLMGLKSAHAQRTFIWDLLISFRCFWCPRNLFFCSALLWNLPIQARMQPYSSRALYLVKSLPWRRTLEWPYAGWKMEWTNYQRNTSIQSMGRNDGRYCPVPRMAPGRGRWGSVSSLTRDEPRLVSFVCGKWMKPLRAFNGSSKKSHISYPDFGLLTNKSYQTAFGGADVLALKERVDYTKLLMIISSTTRIWQI